MSPRTSIAVLTLLSGLTLGLPSASHAAVTAAANAPVVRRASVAMTATDSGTALQTCDPNHPDAGFSIENVERAPLSGSAGIVVQGDLVNHCTTAATDIVMGAIFADSSGVPQWTTSFQPDFGVVAPGRASPFLALLPADVSNVGGFALATLKFTPVADALPDLQLNRGASTPTDGGVDVPFSVRNAGTVAAPLPLIAGRLNGAGCGAPPVLDYLQEGSALVPGGVVTGNLFIPDSCNGVPEVLVGSDAPLPSALASGLSFAAVTTVYTPDGVLHVVAKLCNGSSQDAILPALRARFSGPSGPLDFSLSGTGIYSGRSCAPLLATVPGAPPGLTFQSLLPGAQIEAAVTVAATHVDPRDELIRKTIERVKQDCDGADDKAILASGAVNELQYLSEECKNAFIDEMVALELGVVRSSGLSAAAALDTPSLLTYVYNNTGSPLSAAAYQVQSLGYTSDGTLVAGIEVALPPDLAPHSWGVALTPLDVNSVIAEPTATFRVDGEAFAIPK